MLTRPIVLFWQSFGPYHFARLQAVEKVAGGNLWGIEVADSSSTYAWRREFFRGRVLTLFPGYVAEQIPSSKIYLRLYRLFRDIGPAVVFVPSYWPLYSVAAAAAAKRAGARVVVMSDSHLASGNRGWFGIRAKRFLMRSCDAAFVAGAPHRRYFEMLGMSASKIEVGYDTVDNEFFQKRSAEIRDDDQGWRRRLRLPRRYLLSLGRWVEKKNLSCIVEAFAMARASSELRGVSLVFVGAGAEGERIKAEASSLGLRVSSDLNSSVEADVYFYPFAQLDAVPAYYALAEAFILASTHEEWGLVVNEALACGCPVIVSRAAGCAEDLVEHDVNGYKFEPSLPKQLALYLRRICNDAELRHRFAERGRQQVAKFSNQRFAEAVMRLVNAAQADVIAQSQPQIDRSALKVILLQTCFPDYRREVFELLSAKLGSGFEVWAGLGYFSSGITDYSEHVDWRRYVSNKFINKRSLLWQRNVTGLVGFGDLVIIELNPRILTNWLILIGRRLIGGETLLWGHVWARSGPRSWTNVFRLLMIMCSHGVICYTGTQGRQLARMMPWKNVTVAPNSVVKRMDMSFGEKLEGRDAVLFVGRLIREKKPMLLLKAFNLALSKMPAHTCLVFIGAGDAAPELRDYVAANNLGERVVLTGHVALMTELKKWYDRALCSVSPGYVGLAALQSFAHGVPMIVARDEKHAPEVESCIDGFNARFFRSGDVDELASLLVKMWEERAQWNERRERIVEWTKKNYTIESMVERFEEAIKLMSRL